MSRYRINPGEFRHRITIQKMSEIENDYGELLDTCPNFLIDFCS